MLVVVADPRDAGAQRLVEHWRPHGARLLAPRDLCAPGWRFEVPAAGGGAAVIAGERVATAELRGVVTRISGVRGADLAHIVDEDREYVAAELNAFLTAWLDALPCPVVNRPSAASLLGPALSHERWLAVAARAGLAVATPRHVAPMAERPTAAAFAAVVGDRWFGELAPALGAQAVRLARAAGVELMTARFTGPDAGAAFASADLLVDVTPEVADALRARIEALS